MKVNRKEIITLEAIEMSCWQHMHSILQEIHDEVEDEEIKELTLLIADHMEMLEEYFY